MRRSTVEWDWEVGVFKWRRRIGREVLGVAVDGNGKGKGERAGEQVVGWWYDVAADDDIDADGDGDIDGSGNEMTIGRTLSELFEMKKLWMGELLHRWVMDRLWGRF